MLETRPVVKNVNDSSRDVPLIADPAGNLRVECVSISGKSGATQISEQGEADNTLVELHAVTASKTLYISLLIFSYWTTSPATGKVSCFVTNGGDVFQYYLVRTLVPAASDGMVVPISFKPGLEIPAGYKIKLWSEAAGVGINGFIHGWEQ
jgi:hypothetical protein